LRRRATRKGPLPVNAGEWFDAVVEAGNTGIWMVHRDKLLRAGEGAAGLAFHLIVE
jgi:hypothetical protein